MCFTQFLTTRQLMTKNVDLSVKTPYMQQQKMMMYVFPVMYIFIGINMPVGVLIYMVTSNLWTLGQQLVIIRQNPTPGSVAFKARQERLKAAGKLNADGTPVKAGLAGLVKGGAPVVEEAPEDTAPVRRQQPKRQTKSQRQGGGSGGGSGTAGTAPADAVVQAAQGATKVSTEKVSSAAAKSTAQSAAQTPAQARGRAKTSTSGSTGGQASGGGQGAGQKRSNQPGKRNPQPAGRANSKKKS
jgi:YidC/Oxa1 family membrane protein insertase